MGQTHGLSPEMAGQCCHWVAGMLTGSCCSYLTGPGGNQADFGPRFDHKSPHKVSTLLRGDPHKLLSTSRITQYQGQLCENPYVTTEPCQALNLATHFLWEKVGPHKIARKYASRPDLRDQPILDTDWVLYTNGTSLVKQGQ